MQSFEPIYLKQKVDYILEKIQRLYILVDKSQDYNEKVQFIQAIDNIIQILLINDKKLIINTKESQQNNSYVYQKEMKIIQIEKMISDQNLRFLEQKEYQIKIGKLQLKIQNLQLRIEILTQQLQQKDTKSKQYINTMKQKILRLQHINQLQKSDFLSISSAKSVEEITNDNLRQKIIYFIHQNRLKVKMPDHCSIKNPEGLSFRQIITNCTQQKQQTCRTISCRLPIMIQANKILYGIKVGIQLSNREIIYFEEVKLYEKQQIRFEVKNGHMVFEYLKRKVKKELNRIKIFKQEIVIMLYGKGDSIVLYQQ